MLLYLSFALFLTILTLKYRIRFLIELMKWVPRAFGGTARKTRYNIPYIHWAHYCMGCPLNKLLRVYILSALIIIEIYCRPTWSCLVGLLCLTSHRQRGHLETAPPFTVPCEGLEAKFLHRPHRESNPGWLRGSPLHNRCATPAPSYM